MLTVIRANQSSAAFMTESAASSCCPFSVHCMFARTHAYRNTRKSILSCVYDRELIPAAAVHLVSIACLHAHMLTEICANQSSAAFMTESAASSCCPFSVHCTFARTHAYAYRNTRKSILSCVYDIELIPAAAVHLVSIPCLHAHMLTVVRVNQSSAAFMTESAASSCCPFHVHCIFARTHAYRNTRKSILSCVYDRERSQQLLSI